MKAPPIRIEFCHMQWLLCKNINKLREGQRRSTLKEDRVRWVSGELLPWAGSK
jgi:hypothetical protein